MILRSAREPNRNSAPNKKPEHKDRADGDRNEPVHALHVLHADRLIDADDTARRDRHAQDLAVLDILSGNAHRAHNAVGKIAQEQHVHHADQRAQDRFGQDRQSQLAQTDVFRSLRPLLP